MLRRQYRESKLLDRLGHWAKMVMARRRVLNLKRARRRKTQLTPAPMERRASVFFYRQKSQSMRFLFLQSLFLKPCH